MTLTKMLHRLVSKESSSVLQCSTLCYIRTSALLGRVGSPMVQHLLTALKEPTAAKRKCYSRSCCFLALLCGTRAGRQRFHYTALEIYGSFENSLVGCYFCCHGNRVLKMGHVPLN